MKTSNELLLKEGFIYDQKQFVEGFISNILSRNI